MCFVLVEKRHSFVLPIAVWQKVHEHIEVRKFVRCNSYFGNPNENIAISMDEEEDE
jgi:hypothetical protein